MLFGWYESTKPGYWLWETTALLGRTDPAGTLQVGGSHVLALWTSGRSDDRILLCVPCTQDHRFTGQSARLPADRENDQADYASGYLQASRVLWDAPFARLRSIL